VYNGSSGFSLGYHKSKSNILDLSAYWMTEGPNQLFVKGGHPMSFQDKSIQCSDCGTTFTFSADEQELFASRGYTNDPKRCMSCRQARKAERHGNSSYGSPRQMFPAVCAECGKDTEVPFEPRGDRPVYCSDCFSKVRTSQ
jgi:CxxC-x17-CxxC domain-containing protein